MPKRNHEKSRMYVTTLYVNASIPKDFILSSKNRKSFHTMKYFSQNVFHSMEAFIYTKEFCAAEIWFYLHKEFLKKNQEKSMVYLKIFRAARASLLRISFKKNHEESKICLKIFSRCARQSVKNFSRKVMENQLYSMIYLKIFRAARASLLKIS